MEDKEIVVEKIRSQYTRQAPTELDALKALDAKVKKPARVFGYTWGSVGAVIMGGGMSLCMTDIGTVLGISEPLLPGVVIGVVGLAMALTACPIYKKLLSARKEKFAEEVIALSDRIMKG